MPDDKKYTVLKERLAQDLPAGTKVYVPLGITEAANGKEAVVKITKDSTPEDKNGNFAAPSTRNFPVYPRKVKMVEADEFGEPTSPRTAGSTPPAPKGN